jgi:NAD(P)-dependent dehydrogenase (short-subunit alcohol dehydrogenase family)
MKKVNNREIRDLMNLSGRKCLITGGGGYIGRVIAETLLELGGSVILLDQNRQTVEDTCRALTEKYDALVKHIVCDLEDMDEIEKIACRLENSLDVLVNNAAFVGTSDLVGWSTDFESQILSTWDRALSVNLTAVFRLTQLMYPLLKNSATASVINIGSIYGFLGPDRSLYKGTEMDSPAAYAVSKGGVLQLTKWMATTLAPNIRVNAISPGGIERGQNPAFVRRYERRTPLGRMGREEDLKGAVAYLASDMSEWVTGQNIIVDGGWSAW